MNETTSTDSSVSSDIPQQQQKKKKSNFVPGDPHIPMLVRVYGSIIAAISIEIIILTVIPLIILIPFNITNLPMTVLPGVGILALAYILYRMGKGVCNGERRAIYGLTVVGALTLVIAIEIIIAGSPIGGAILFIFTLALCLPPIWVSFHRWELFK
ncbi:MAG TPA: hypothetical protein PLW02_05880 [Verrucomicrobiota bacterium]|nr:hypothetical protein [Verrucomicrobiota bacterium]